MRSFHLKPGRAKPLWLGHPWVFTDSIARVEEPSEQTETSQTDPDWVRVVDADGKVVGYGFCSEQSAIRVRLLARGPTEERPASLLRAGIKRAVALRKRLFPDPRTTSAYRLVHAEGDGLPGLVADRLGDVVVAQFGTAATYARRELLGKLLLEETGARCLVARAAGFEQVEGIPTEPRAFTLGEPVPERVEVREEGLTFVTSPLAGQKTGHYADQRENRRLVGELARGLEVLDLYAGTGGFSLHSLRAGAAQALAIDASARSIEAATNNAACNDLAEHFEARKQDVNAVLAELRLAKKHFGLVIADPPNFFPRKKGPERLAMKAYRELNVRALSRVAPNGFLATFSCSARLKPQGFLEMLRSASRECRRDFRVLRELGAGPDHPVAAGLPQGRYLTGFLLQVGAP